MKHHLDWSSRRAHRQHLECKDASAPALTTTSDAKRDSSPTSGRLEYSVKLRSMSGRRGF